MAGFEKESHLIAPVTIRRPTALDLSRLLETQKINPEISITCIKETRRATLYEVVGLDKTDQLLKQLGELHPFKPLKIDIIVHELPRD